MFFTCFAFFLGFPNRLLSQNCFAPLGESIFDEFLWDEVQESADFSNRVTQKGAEIDRREAHGFESRLVIDFSKTLIDFALQKRIGCATIKTTNKP